MAAPIEVSRVTVSDGINIQPGQGNYPIRTVTFYVGEQGPFRLVYRTSAYSVEAVNDAMQKEVDGLRAIGAIE
jgi:hypothetical protein